MQTSDISGLGAEETAATDPAEGPLNDHAVQFVAFSVGAQNFCIDIMQVREIRAWSGATALPNAPEFVRGVINLRGHIVPVVDLSARFGLGPIDTETGSVVVIVMIEEKLHGLLVDSVSDILNVGPGDIAPAPSVAADGQGGFLGGIVTHDDDMVAVIDLVRLVEAN